VARLGRRLCDGLWLGFIEGFWLGLEEDFCDGCLIEGFLLCSKEGYCAGFWLGITEGFWLGSEQGFCDFFWSGL
jgi:hypothetical protein